MVKFKDNTFYGFPLDDIESNEELHTIQKQWIQIYNEWLKKIQARNARKLMGDVKSDKVVLLSYPSMKSKIENITIKISDGFELLLLNSWEPEKKEVETINIGMFQEYISIMKALNKKYMT
jgi:hypothetical protein